MLSVISKIFDVFGAMPWAERFISTGVNQALFATFISLAKQVTGVDNLDEALFRLKENKELELEFQMALIAAEAEHMRSGVEDRRNARERDMDIRKLQGKNFRANIMLFIAAFGLLGCLICLFNMRTLLSPELIGIISTVAGIFGACLKDAYSFEFGKSSLKSVDND